MAASFQTPQPNTWTVRGTIVELLPQNPTSLPGSVVERSQIQ